MNPSTGTTVRVEPTILLLWEVVASDPVSIRVGTTPQERRFWARVDVNGPVNPRRPELGECWLWTATRGFHKGQLTYGQTSYGGRRTGAHRASFLMHGGTVPDGYDVMHLCDVKHCVRPSHLRAGTRAENLLDGFASPANQYQPRLAQQYGVSQAQISQIIAGKKWPESKCPVHGSVRTAAA